jgi:hypothetical protein
VRGKNVGIEGSEWEMSEGKKREIRREKEQGTEER